MTLSGSLVNEASINSDGDAFFEIFSRKPYLTVDMSPLNIRRVDLIDGDWGSVGLVLMWNYFYGGIDVVAKEVVETIDGEKKLVCFKVVDGNTKGLVHLVTWTLTYEKLNENIEDPNGLMEFCLNVTKDIDIYHIFIIFSGLHLAYFTFYPILYFHRVLSCFVLIADHMKIETYIVADQKVVGLDIKLDGPLWTFGIIWAFEDAVMMMIVTFWLIFGPKMGVHGLFTNVGRR
ncbi:hypothetical protein LXL04_022061 [Taraxacum kok-saghyz]